MGVAMGTGVDTASAESSMAMSPSVERGRMSPHWSPTDRSSWGWGRVMPKGVTGVMGPHTTGFSPAAVVVVVGE